MELRRWQKEMLFDIERLPRNKEGLLQVSGPPDSGDAFVPPVWAAMVAIARDHRLLTVGQLQHLLFSLGVESTRARLERGDQMAWREALTRPIEHSLTYKMRRKAPLEENESGYTFDEFERTVSDSLRSLLRQRLRHSGDQSAWALDQSSRDCSVVPVVLDARVGRHPTFGGPTLVPPGGRKHSKDPQWAVIAGPIDFVSGTKTDDQVAPIPQDDVGPDSTPVDYIPMQPRRYPIGERKRPPQARTMRPTEQQMKQLGEYAGIPQGADFRIGVAVSDTSSGSQEYACDFATVVKSSASLGIVWFRAPRFARTARTYFVELVIAPTDSVRLTTPHIVTVEQIRRLWTPHTADSFELRFLPLHRGSTRNDLLLVGKQYRKNRWQTGPAFGYRAVNDGRFPDHQLLVVVRPECLPTSRLKRAWTWIRAFRDMRVRALRSWEERADIALAAFIDFELSLYDEDPDPTQARVTSGGEEARARELTEGIVAENWKDTVLAFHGACESCFRAKKKNLRSEQEKRSKLFCPACGEEANRAELYRFRAFLRRERVEHLVSLAVAKRVGRRGPDVD